MIARDWFRYAEHVQIEKNSQTRPFMIYNRAWSGSREYRLKFADLLIDADLVQACTMSVNAHDPQGQIHYLDHQFKHARWKPANKLEDYFLPTQASSASSADFDIKDYVRHDFEIVLETLFDDDRLHLTEKILRPLALSQPFLLCGTKGSLEYLRSYGFETFSPWVDESYDQVDDAGLRLEAVVRSMRQINSWSDAQRSLNMRAISDVCRRNRQRFFSQDFHQSLVDELRHNLHRAIDDLESTNTCGRWFERRKYLAGFPEINQHQLSAHDWRSRKDIADLVTIARKYRK